jgi:hypothetical protein
VPVGNVFTSSSTPTGTKNLLILLQVEGKVRASLQKSLSAMRISSVDILVLHSNIVPDDYQTALGVRDTFTRWDAYVKGWIPTVESLQREGCSTSNPTHSFHYYMRLDCHSFMPTKFKDWSSIGESLALVNLTLS